MGSRDKCLFQKVVGVIDCRTSEKDVPRIIRDLVLSFRTIFKRFLFYGELQNIALKVVTLIGQYLFIYKVDILVQITSFIKTTPE